MGVLVALCATARAEATPPTRSAIPIASAGEALTTEEGVRAWLQHHAADVETGLSHHMPWYADKTLVLEHARVQHRTWQHDRSWIVGAEQRKLFVVIVPFVKHGVPWVEHAGHVIVGFDRPYNEEIREEHQAVATVNEQPVVHVEAHSNHHEGMLRLGVNEPFRPTDIPVPAETIELLVDDRGMIFF